VFVCPHQPPNNHAARTILLENESSTFFKAVTHVGGRGISNMGSRRDGVYFKNKVDLSQN